MLRLSEVTLLSERRSGSVHARVGRLQAIDREQARLDRPHRPAPCRDPELLPVPVAAELLSRSTCHTRCETPVTPQTTSMRGRFECCADRSAPTAGSSGDMAVRYEGCFRGRGDRQCRGFREEFSSTHYGHIIQVRGQCCNILTTVPLIFENKIIEEGSKLAVPGTDVAVIYASQQTAPPRTAGPGNAIPGRCRSRTRRMPDSW